MRQATVEDVAALARHRVEMFTDMGQLHEDAYGELLRASADYLRSAMSAGEYVAWVATSPSAPDTIIGGAGVQLRPMLPRPADDGRRLLAGPEAIIVNVFTERAWRRRGVAELLMRELLSWADARRLGRVVLHASPDGRALYEKLGFVATSEMRRPRA